MVVVGPVDQILAPLAQMEVDLWTLEEEGETLAHLDPWISVPQALGLLDLQDLLALLVPLVPSAPLVPLAP